MKKIPVLALAAVLAISVFTLIGCGQSKGQVSDRGSMGGTCVSTIDVGKGDCILLQSGDSAALIDTGYEKTAGDVLSYLKERGVSHLDFVVLTHYDRDHVEGLREIGKKLDIGTVYLPGYEGSDKNYRIAISAVEDLGLKSQKVTEQLHLKLGDNDLEVYPSSVEYVPGTKGEEGNDNDMSLVATLTGSDASYLFAGDLEAEGIDAFLKRGLGHFDVLKMPHHGKKSSGTEKLLESVKPKVAIITDSEDDPAEKKTLKELDAIGADVYRTSKSGTFAVRSNGAGGYTVSE